MLTWAGRWPERRWAIENAEGLGRHLASWLLARGEAGRRCVHECDGPGPAAFPRRWPEERPDRCCSRGVCGGVAGRCPSVGGRRCRGRHRCVGRAAGEPVAGQGAGGEPVARRVPGIAGWRRTNRIDGRGSRSAAADSAAGRVRLNGSVSTLQVTLVAEIRSLDARLKGNAEVMAELVKASGSTLEQTVGIGPVMAGRLIGGPAAPAGSPRRPRMPPIPVSPRSRWPAVNGPGTGCPVRGSSAELHLAHHRGDPDPDGREPGQHLLPHQDRREEDPAGGSALPETAPGQSHLADHDRRRATSGGSGRTLGGDSAIQRDWPTSSSDKSLPRPTIRDSTTAEPAA